MPWCFHEMKKELFGEVKKEGMEIMVSANFQGINRHRKKVW